MNDILKLLNNTWILLFLFFMSLSLLFSNINFILTLFWFGVFVVSLVFGWKKLTKENSNEK